TVARLPVDPKEEANGPASSDRSCRLLIEVEKSHGQTQADEDLYQASPELILADRIRYVDPTGRARQHKEKTLR
ncbi:MAG: hypothetical protein ACK53L_26380, partial [Pirellulaceae bacterium]